MKLAIAVFAGASIVGCAVQDQTVTEINAAEWLDRDREFAYIHHTFTGHNDGIVRPTSVYSASGIDIYRRAVEADGIGERELLYRKDAVLPCGEMLYRPDDASLFLSYKEMDRHNVLQRHYCGDEGDGKKILKLRLEDGTWNPVELAETDSLIGRELESSRNRSAEKGLAIDSVYESLCIGDHCITQ
jgi:hypothetical protein